MLTIIEKVMFLQNVDVFYDVPTEQLSYLAAISEEVEYLKGDTVYKVEEPSDAMYLVLEGKVKLHREDEEVITSGAKEAFGTWALFGEEPRVVTATAVEESRLLRIEREDFYDLLADDIQITQGIINALAKRMRKLIDHVGLEPAGKNRS
ncbi:Crp/Fnr family transcriptional regulator [candidate division KSB1 bacterium]